jgi:phosphoglycerate kinase
VGFLQPDGRFGLLYGIETELNMKILRADELNWSKIPEAERRAFVRVDFNVPMKGDEILEDFRICQAVPTLQYLLDQKCIVIVASHLGRPKGGTAEDKKKFSMLPVAERLAQIMNREVLFSEEHYGDGLKRLVLDGRGGKTLIVLENLRFDPREEQNDRIFAEELMANADLYFNDAFGASHRAHASIDAITQFAKVKAAGFLLSKEWTVLNQVLHHPKEPQMAVLGGAKISDKIEVIKNLIQRCDALFVGGRMGLTFLASQGVDLGASSIEQESLPIARRLMVDAKNQGVKIHLPMDGVGADLIDATEGKIYALGEGLKCPPTKAIFDIGPETLKAWKKELQKAQSIVWNGPMGVFENPTFAAGTLGLVDFLVEVKDTIPAVCGGGETVAAVMQRGAFEAIHHVSTGGGAMLEFLEGKALPGFEALKLRDREIAAMA